MNVHCYRPVGAGGRARERGSATVVVFILVTLVVAMLIGNGRALGRLKRELRLVERQQVERWGMPAATNPPPAAVPATPR